MNPTNEPPILVTRQQASELLQLSVRAIDHLIATGRLPSRRMGRRRLVPRTALEQFARHDQPHIAPMQEAARK